MADFGLVKLCRLVGAVERKRGNYNVEILPGRRNHLVGAGHDSRWRRQGRAAGILESLTRSQDRLLADNAVAVPLNVTLCIASPFLGVKPRQTTAPLAVAVQTNRHRHTANVHARLTGQTR